MPLPGFYSCSGPQHWSAGPPSARPWESCPSDQRKRVGFQRRSQEQRTRSVPNEEWASVASEWCAQGQVSINVCLFGPQTFSRPCNVPSLYLQSLGRAETKVTGSSLQSSERKPQTSIFTMYGIHGGLRAVGHMPSAPGPVGWGGFQNTAHARGWAGCGGQDPPYQGTKRGQRAAAVWAPRLAWDPASS